MRENKYGFEKDLPGMAFDDAVQRIREALKTEGFGVLTEIDVAATMKAKLDVDFRRYLILGACQPNLALQALQAEPQVGLLMPCNVVVQELDGQVTISIASAPAMLKLAENSALDPVQVEADQRLRRALNSLG